APRLAARLEEERELALLFRDLATLRVERSLMKGTAELEWRGPASGFVQVCTELGDPALADRVASLAGSRQGGSR
ncbi:MAG: hypothetical protein ACRDV4_04750, partial [Acidimicrobiales bacterium]